MVELKAREYQATLERLEGMQKDVQGMEAKKRAVEDTLSSLQLSLLKEQEHMVADRRLWEKDAATHDKRVFGLRKEVLEAEKKLNELHTEIKESEKAVGKVAELRKEQGLLEQSIGSLSTEKSRLSNEVALSRKELVENKKQKSNVQEIAQELINDIMAMHKNTQDFHAKVYFYIRRIVQWYREQGRSAPEVFEEFKPSVVLRKDVLMRLKREGLSHQKNNG